jgi:hypothetical protein
MTAIKPIFCRFEAQCWPTPPVIFYCDQEQRRRFYRDVHPLSRLIEFETGIAVGAMVTDKLEDVSDRLEDKEWIENPGARTYDWHYRHNLNLLTAAYRLAGRSGQAEVVLQKLAILPSRSVLDEYYQAQWAAFELENGRNSETLAVFRKYLKPRTDVGLVLEHAIRGSALFQSGSPGPAANELAIAKRHLDS